MSVIDDINRRSKGAALAEEIRALLPLMSEGYCVTCGSSNPDGICCPEWE